MSSSKKTVVVTGGSRGIGKAVALQLAKAGHNVVALGRSKDDLEQVAREIGADDRTLALVCDVTKRDDIDQALNAAVQKFGSVDCWINNAGVGINKPAELLDDNDFDTMMMLNCKSALYCMQAALKHYKSKASPSGQIINVSSMLSRFPTATFRSAYSAAKAALNSLTANLRMEIADQGHKDIHICLFVPGVVGTDFGLNAMHGGGDNRLLPGCQDVDDCASVIVGMVHDPTKVDVYSRPSYKQDILNYYSSDDMKAHEISIRTEFYKKFKELQAQRAAAAAASAGSSTSGNQTVDSDAKQN